MTGNVVCKHGGVDIYLDTDKGYFFIINNNGRVIANSKNLDKLKKRIDTIEHSEYNGGQPLLIRPQLSTGKYNDVKVKSVISNKVLFTDGTYSYMYPNIGELYLLNTKDEYDDFVSKLDNIKSLVKEIVDINNKIKFIQHDIYDKYNKYKLNEFKVEHLKKGQ